MKFDSSCCYTTTLTALDPDFVVLAVLPVGLVVVAAEEAGDEIPVEDVAGLRSRGVRGLGQAGLDGLGGTGGGSE